MTTVHPPVVTCEVNGDTALRLPVTDSTARHSIKLHPVKIIPSDCPVLITSTPRAFSTVCSARLLRECRGEIASFPAEAVYLHESVVRGHHVYKRVWSPAIGEVLKLSREEDTHDRFAVCVVKGELIVGLVPCRLTRTVWHFLGRSGEATCEVIERRKFGNGLEVPCLYRFVGKEHLVQKLKGLLEHGHQPLSNSCS